MSRKHLLFWIIYCSLILSYHIPTLTEKIPSFSQQAFVGFLKSSFSQRIGTISTETTQKKVWLYFHCRTSTVIILTFEQTSSNGVGETAFYVTIWTLLEKKNRLTKFYFPPLFRKVSVSFLAFCWRFLIGFAKVHSFHMFTRKFLPKFFRKNCNFSIKFGSSTNFFGLLLKLFQELSKMQSTCTEEHFGEKFTVLENLQLPINFGNWVENCRPSSKMLLAGSSNLLSTWKFYVSR